MISITLTDLNEERQRLYNVYPVQKLLDIARGQEDVDDESTYLHSGDAVALRGEKDNHWLSCWGSGSDCKARGCPGKDRPFQKDDSSQYTVDCRGELFWIYAEKRRRGESIRHNDRVALLYSHMNGKRWWVSNHGETMSSPGSSFYNGGPNVNWCCDNEYFRITTNGQPSATGIRDRQVIQLKNKKSPCYLKTDGKCSDSYTSDVHFQLFRRYSPFSVASHNYQTQNTL